MKNILSFEAMSLLAIAFTVGCGGATNTVKTKEDASKIRSAMSAAQAGVSLGGEAACPEGGTVKSEQSIGVDALKGEISTTLKYTFSGCVAQGISINGSWSQILRVAGGSSTMTNTGHVDTSLGSCIVDMKGTTVSAAVSGMFCGFDYATLP
jgi:hypothetical protein